MPRFKQTGEILKLMHDKNKVRNIGIIAHIDHGKTTMSDSLLAMAGLMAPTRAGEARALDFLEEEQKRGITIKTANISLLYEEEGNQYVINLIDTPGHVDFSGKVTRSLRVLDGGILVLCAVGGVQSQSITVDRQMRRYSIPRIYFINKCDRVGANPEKVCVFLSPVYPDASEYLHPFIHKNASDTVDTGVHRQDRSYRL